MSDGMKGGFEQTDVLIHELTHVSFIPLLTPIHNTHECNL